MSQQQISQEDFKTALVKWIENDNLDKAYSKKAREAKKIKRQYDEYIIEYLEQTGDTELTVSGYKGVIKKKVIKRKKPIDRKLIEEVLKIMLKNGQKAEDLAQEIEKRREVVEKTTIQRTIKKENGKPKKK